MAGWFEAFANFAGAGANALDRYQQLRRLDDESRRRDESDAWQKQYQQHQLNVADETAQRQQQQLDQAILRGNQEFMTDTLTPDQDLTPDVMAQMHNYKLDHLIKPEQFNPMELASKPISLPGKSYYLEPDLADPGEDGPQQITDAGPMRIGALQLPEQAMTGPKYRGTPEQLLNYERTYGPQLRRQQGINNASRIDWSNPTAAIIQARMSGLPEFANLQISDIVQNKPNAPQGSEFERFNALPADQKAAYLIDRRKFTDAVDTTPNKPVGDGPVDTGGPKDSFGLSTRIPSELRMVAKLPLMNLQAKYQRGDQAAVLNDMWESGDVDNFRNTVKQSVLDNSKVTTAAAKSQYEARQGLRQNLSEISTLMKEAQTVGGKAVPNWQNATLETVANTFGVSRDPKLQELGVRMKRVLQDYTHNVSGAAFSAKEFDRYQAVNPNWKNDVPLNNVRIKSLQEINDITDNVFWQTRLGGKSLSKYITSPFVSIDPAGKVHPFDSQEEKDAFDAAVNAASQPQQAAPQSPRPQPSARGIARPSVR